MGRLLAVLAAPCLLFAADSTLAQPIAVESGRLTTRFLLTGELVAEDALRLSVPNANIWPMQVRWLAEDGVEVAAGETLVEFDDSQLASQIEQLERAVVEARNQLASLEASVRRDQLEAEFRVAEKSAALEKAEIGAALPRELVAGKAWEESRLELQRAGIERAEAVAALEFRGRSGLAKIAKQRVALEKAALAAGQARGNLELLTLVAPRAGVLLVAENSQEGRTFRAGDSTWPGTTICSLPELSSMIVEARLFDVDDGRVAIGQPVTAVVDAFPETVLHGEIIDVDNVANETSRFSMRRIFRTRVRLDGIDLERMRPGMSVKVMVEIDLEDVPLIRRSGIEWVDSATGAVAEAVFAGGGRRRVKLGPCDRLHCVLESDANVAPAGEPVETQ